MMRHFPNLPTARGNVRDDIGFVATAMGAIALLGLFIAAFVSVVHIPAGDNGGVVGWLTIHHYAKRGESVNWIAALLAAVGLGFALARLEHIPVLRLNDGLERVWLAVPAVLLVLIEAAWSGPPPALLLFVCGVALTCVLAVVLVRRKGGTGPTPLAETAAGDDTSLLAGGDSPRFILALAVALALANGLMLGWYAPVLLGPGFAFMRFVIPLALALLPLRLMPDDREGTTIAVAIGTLPLAAMIFAPFFPTGPFVVALVGISAVATFALLHSRARLVRTFVPYGAVISFAAVCASVALSHNPHLLPGWAVAPLDGDAIMSWTNDGLLGKVVFRDFWYPYGPLEYVPRELSAAWFGLDRHAVPLRVYEAIVSAVCAAISARALFGRSVVVPAIAALAYAAYDPSPRVWIPFTGVALTVWALRSGGRRIGAAGGALVALALIVSAEAGLAASVAVALLFAAAVVTKRSPIAALSRPGLGWIAGFGVVLGCALFAGLTTGMATSYVANIVQLAGAVDVCCGLPYPSIFGGLNALGAPPLSALEPRFVAFYAVPGILLGALLVLSYRYAKLRALSELDWAIFAMVLFGAVLFRSALGRSEAGHLAFVSLPAIAVLLLFADRALRAFRLRPVTALAAIVVVVVFPAFRANVMAHLDDANRYLAAVGATLAVTELPTPPGLTLVSGSRGERFWFLAADGDDVAHVRDYLRGHVKPGELVYSMPYAARYEVLLGLPSPGHAGPVMWGADARPREQRALVDALGVVRYVVYDEAEWPDTDGVAWIDRYPFAAAALRASYRPVATFGQKVVYERGTPPPPPRSLDLGTVDASPFLVSGWYAREIRGSRPGRWTAVDASFRLTPAANDDALALDVIAPDPPPATRTLTVTVDGTTVGTTQVVAGMPRIVFGLPKSIARGRPVTVRLVSSAPFSAVDFRELNVYVESATTGSARALRVAAPAAAVAKPVSGARPAVAIPVIPTGSWSGSMLRIVLRDRKPDAIEWVQAATNSILNGRGACYINVNPGHRTAFLAKDSGTDWNDPMTVGGASSVSNTACKFDASKSAIEQRGNDTVIRLSVELHPPGDRPHMRTWLRTSETPEMWTPPFDAPSRH